MNADELRFGALLADAGTLVWHAGADRIDVDEAGARLFGVTRAAFAQDLASLLRQIREGSRDALTTAFERAIVGAALIEVEVEVDLPALAVRTLHLRGAVLDAPSGEADRIVLAVRDVSAAAAARAELAVAHVAIAERASAHERAIAQLERAARDRGELVAGLSREVRTRRGAVLGMSRLLLDGPLAAEQREQIATIASAGAELLAFTADTIDIAGDGAPAEVELGVIAVQELIGGAVGALLATARARAIRIRATIDGGVPAAIRTDVTRLDRALRYALREAIGGAPAGGEVVVTARARRLAGSLHDLELEIAGGGAYAGALPLGLSVAARLMTRMGGVQSVVDTRVALEVSVDAAQLGQSGVHPMPFEPDPLMAVRHPLRVLVAEDNPVNRRVIEAFLGRLGYRPRLATTGREAIELAAREAFDLIVMDVQMPEVDGLEATRAIKARATQSRPPPRIVALTANALPQDRAACLRAGCDDYLAKPITLDKLAAALVATAPTPQQAREAAALDEKKLNKLDAALGGALLAQILGTHETDARELVHALRGAADRADASALARLAKTLVFTSEILGATALAHVAARLAAACESGDATAAAPEAVEQIARELAEARLALAPRLASA